MGAFILLVTFGLMILIPTSSKSSKYGNIAEETNVKTLNIWEVAKVPKVHNEEG